MYMVNIYMLMDLRCIHAVLRTYLPTVQSNSCVGAAWQPELSNWGCLAPIAVQFGPIGYNTHPVYKYICMYTYIYIEIEMLFFL